MVDTQREELSISSKFYLMLVVILPLNHTYILADFTTDQGRFQTMSTDYITNCKTGPEIS